MVLPASRALFQKILLIFDFCFNMSLYFDLSRSLMAFLSLKAIDFKKLKHILTLHSCSFLVYLLPSLIKYK